MAYPQYTTTSFTSPRGLAVWITLFYGLDAVCIAALGILVFFRFMPLLKSGGPKDEDIPVVAALGLAGLVVLFVEALALLLLLCWTYRVTRNMRAFGPIGKAWAPGWGFWGFIVPAVNIVLPYLVLRQVWRVSDPELPGSKSDEWCGRPGPPLLRLWWVAWLAGGAAPCLVVYAMTGDLREPDRAALASACLALFLLVRVLTMSVVWAFSNRQVAKMRALASAAAAVQAVPVAPRAAPLALVVPAAQAKALRTVARCTKCGGACSPADRFCGTCGAPLPKACPRCQTALVPGAAFCPRCGHPVGKRAV